MYSMIVDNKSQFDVFLNSVDSEWVDVILGERGALFIQNTSEMFAVYQMQSSRSSDEVNRNFRVKKSLLKLLTVEGTLSIAVKEDTVDYTFANESVSRSVTAPKHQAYTFSFKDKLNILRTTKAQAFDASDLRRLVNISRSLHSFVEVCDGVAGVMSRGGIRIYKKVQIPSLSLSAKAAHALFSCKSYWYCEQNYVMAVDGHFGIVVSQCRGSGQEDYNTLIQDDSKSAAILTADFSDVLHVVSKATGAIMELDVRKGICKLSDGDIIYAINVPMHDVRVSEKFDKVVTLNTKVFTELMPKLGSVTDVVLKIKKHFCLLEVDDYIIVSK